MSKTTRRPSYEVKSLREQTRRFENETLIQLGGKLDRFPKSLLSHPRQKMLRQLKRADAKTSKRFAGRIYQLVRGYEIRQSRVAQGQNPEQTIFRHRSQWETKCSQSWRNHV